MQSRRQRATAEVGEPSVGGCLYNVFYTLIFCIVGMGLPLFFAKDPSPAQWLAIVPTFLIANFVEYGIHRWLMHRNVKPLAFMLKLHMVHHNYFDEDEYYVANIPDYQMVVFPPFVLNLLTLVITLPLAGIAYLIAGKNVALIFIATVMGYYLLMQVLHVSAHIPKGHWIHRLPGIDYIRNHHNIHHNHQEMAHWNFNFIVPVSDRLLGTCTQVVTANSSHRSPVKLLHPDS